MEISQNDGTAYAFFCTLSNGVSTVIIHSIFCLPGFHPGSSSCSIANEVYANYNLDHNKTGCGS